MKLDLKFDIERSCIYSLFTTFRERIYTKTLLGLEDCHHQKRGHPCKEREERDVQVLVHVHGVKLLIINRFHRLDAVVVRHKFECPLLGMVE